MEMVKGKSFKNEPVLIDDIYFHDCVFDGCSLIYSGGPLPSFEKCNFDHCGFEFKGAAENTLSFMTVLYHVGFKELIENAFESIKKWQPSDSSKYRNNKFEES